MAPVTATLRPTGAPLVVADVTLFYGPHSGGIRTYLHERSRFAADTGSIEHHMIVPGERERHRDGLHELPGLRIASTGGFRYPWSADAIRTTLEWIKPDIVAIHDPFWRIPRVTATAHRLGATVVAVHHASAALNAAGIPGPDSLYMPLLRRLYRNAYRNVDAIMSVVDSTPCSGREPTMPLRFGLHPAFHPKPVERDDHVLYVGRIAWEKGINTLLEAVALTSETWQLHLVGDGPAMNSTRKLIKQLGIGDRVVFHPFVNSREELARLYRRASCVVQPGAHETFGLVTLEAAACGTPVVACDTTPATAVVGSLSHTFESGNVRDLVTAIESARRAAPNPIAASSLSRRMQWPVVFRDELRDLTELRQSSPLPDDRQNRLLRRLSWRQKSGSQQPANALGA